MRLKKNVLCIFLFFLFNGCVAVASERANSLGHDGFAAGPITIIGEGFGITRSDYTFYNSHYLIHAVDHRRESMEQFYDIGDIFLTALSSGLSERSDGYHVRVEVIQAMYPLITYGAVLPSGKELHPSCNVEFIKCSDGFDDRIYHGAFIPDIPFIRTEAALKSFGNCDVQFFESYWLEAVYCTNHDSRSVDVKLLYLSSQGQFLYDRLREYWEFEGKDEPRLRDRVSSTRLVAEDLQVPGLLSAPDYLDYVFPMRLPFLISWLEGGGGGGSAGVSENELQALRSRYYIDRRPIDYSMGDYLLMRTVVNRRYRRNKRESTFQVLNCIANNHHVEKYDLYRDIYAEVTKSFVASILSGNDSAVRAEDIYRLVFAKRGEMPGGDGNCFGENGVGYESFGKGHN